jgi:hypothetical protein
MANLDSPKGMSAIQGAGTAPEVREYLCGAGDFPAGAMVNFIAGSGTDDIVLEVWDGSSAEPIVGVLVHEVLTADTVRTALVYTDPRQLFEIQVDDNSFTHMSDYVGGYFVVVNATAMDSNTNRSTMEIDGSTAGVAASSATAVLLGVDKSKDPTVDYTAANPRIITQIASARHAFSGDVGV